MKLFSLLVAGNSIHTENMEDEWRCRTYYLYAQRERLLASQTRWISGSRNRPKHWPRGSPGSLKSRVAYLCMCWLIKKTECKSMITYSFTAERYFWRWRKSNPPAKRACRQCNQGSLAFFILHRNPSDLILNLPRWRYTHSLYMPVTPFELESIISLRSMNCSGVVRFNLSGIYSFRGLRSKVSLAYLVCIVNLFQCDWYFVSYITSRWSRSFGSWGWFMEICRISFKWRLIQQLCSLTWKPCWRKHDLRMSFWG